MANTTNFGWETPDDTDLVKDGAAAVRTLGSAIDTSLIDLKGGTTGQVLSKASNTDMDFTWADGGDITGVTAGVGITGGGTSGSVTITNAMADAITTKGDLVVGTGSDTFARLAAGTNDYVLTAASGESTGLKWAAIPATTNNFTLINTGGTSLTGAATITVSGISGKNSLYIWIDEASSASASSYFQIRFNSDSGSNYRYAGLSLQNTTMVQVRTNPSDTELEFARQGTSAANAVTGFVRVEGVGGTGSKPYMSSSSAGGATPGNSNIYLGSYEGSSAISSVSIISTVGDFDSGTIYVYGA